MRKTKSTVRLGMLCFTFWIVARPSDELCAQINYAMPFTFTTLAGSAGTIGSVDGTNDSARFIRPTSLALDK